MPADNNKESSGNPSQRTTFRPPWVKEGPNPLPVPAQPWELKKSNRRDSNTSDEKSSDGPLGVTLKKVSTQTKEPQENGGLKDVTFEKPKLKPVPPKEINIPKKNKIPLPKLNSVTDATENNPLAGVQLRKTSIKTSEPQENGTKEPEFIKPKLKPVPVRETTPPKKDHKLQLPKLNSVAERKLREPPRKQPSITRMPSNDDELDKEVPATRNALVRAESMRRLSQSHNMPAPPPMPPPAPLMPGEVEKKPLTEEKKQKLEQLRARPKARPDWSSMLKEIEGNKKLKHVFCNDRSEPLLPEAKATDHFVFESEKDNCHNELLKEIQFGIKLKKVKTNDRSKPMLEGLRKFRRQMTIEEQIIKSMSMASIPPEEIPVEEQDEMDDIDKVRDDLQSTKQMLALELRKKEAQIRENKMLQARIQNLEAELEKESNKKAEGGSGNTGSSTKADDKVIKSLKTEADQAKKHSEELEKKYKESAEQLDSTKLQLEEIRKLNRELEKKMQDAMAGKRMSVSDRKNSMANGGDNSDLDFFSSDDEEESDGEDTEEKREKKVQKELKHLRNKLRNFKNKEDNAKKERIALREIIKRNQTAIKQEKKKFKQLQKEVDKMAALMKDVDDEEVEEEEEEKPEEEEDESTEEESSEESETESEESDSEKSQSESEDAPVEKRKSNLEARNNRHESILSALKKGNFMLKTSAERLQDELNQQKDATESLKLDLDSVLSELG